MPFGFYYDSTYILVIIGMIICLAASGIVRSTYNKYAKVRSAQGITGAEAAERILRSQGIYDVQIRQVSGNLTDHYDSRNRTLSLSDSVYSSTSVAAIGVAAHECGHAVQDEVGYAPLKIRHSLVPVASIGSQAGIILVIVGLIFTSGFNWLVQLGIVLFSLAVLFQLVTLPVEFNASRRALVLLQEQGILYQNEVGQARKVLSAAALTYVASAAAGILQLLRLVILAGGRRRD